MMHVNQCIIPHRDMPNVQLQCFAEGGHCESSVLNRGEVSIRTGLMNYL